MAAILQSIIRILRLVLNIRRQKMEQKWSNLITWL